MPLTFLSINTYLKAPNIHVDTEIAHARNIDHIAMQAGLSPKDLAVVDTKKVENGEAQQTLHFEMPLIEFIKKHHISSPTVIYVRLVSHDHDGLTQKSRLQTEEIHPDGAINHITVFPNPGFATDIIFILSGDAQSEHIVQIIHSDGRLIMQTKISGGEHHLTELCGHLQSGIYHIRNIGDAQNNDLILFQKFIILP